MYTNLLYYNILKNHTVYQAFSYSSYLSIVELPYWKAVLNIS